MKKIFLPLFLFTCFLQTAVFADEISVPLPEINKNFNDEGDLIPKYLIMKTTDNYSPVREDADTNAKRFSHLKKGTMLYADSIYKDFFRIDLGLDKYYWIEKKYVEKEKEAEIKELPEIDSIQYSENDKYYTIIIKTDKKTPYNEKETSANSLEFTLYDVRLSKNLNFKGNNTGNFKISKDKFDNLLISYESIFPLVGHEVELTDAELILKVKKPFILDKKKPLKNITVAIDAGHGGGDLGACAFDLKEKDLNLDISILLKEELEKAGANVVMTREDDTNPDLYERVDFAKENKADFLLSIHQNSLANRDMVDRKHGAGVYYYNREAFAPSEKIQNSLLKHTGFRDDGVNFASFALTRTANPVCVLIECGYIIHKEESKMLSDPKFQKIVAKAITEGLEDYLKENFKAK